MKCLSDDFPTILDIYSTAGRTVDTTAALEIVVWGCFRRSFVYTGYPNHVIQRNYVLETLPRISRLVIVNGRCRHMEGGVFQVRIFFKLELLNTPEA